jgi:hypothetical protein
MIPPALDAAADVELVAPGEFSLSLAISSWHVDPVSPAVLSSWWQTYLQSRPSWPVALAALESMRHNDASQSEVPSCGT